MLWNYPYHLIYVSNDFCRKKSGVAGLSVKVPQHWMPSHLVGLAAFGFCIRDGAVATTEGRASEQESSRKVWRARGLVILLTSTIYTFLLCCSALKWLIPFRTNHLLEHGCYALSVMGLSIPTGFLLQGYPVVLPLIYFPWSYNILQEINTFWSKKEEMSTVPLAGSREIWTEGQTHWTFQTKNRKIFGATKTNLENRSSTLTFYLNNYIFNLAGQKKADIVRNDPAQYYHIWGQSNLKKLI